MFFILSKILYYLFVKPLNWIAVSLLYAVFGKKEKWKKRALFFGVGLLLFFSNHFIFNLVIRQWEPTTITLDQIDQPYEVGIVLGGYSNFFIEPNHDRYNFSERGNRFSNALELYRTGKVKKLIFTGGSGKLLDDEPSEAAELPTYLARIGIPEADYIIEPNSRNTRENAVFTKEILDKQFPNASYLLITSAFHMRRSEAIFDKLTIKTTPFAVDYIGEKIRFVPESFLIPDRNGFYHWDILIREWVGYLGYWVRGYV